MNPLESLRPITRRAIPDFYASPGICNLPVPSGSGSGSSVASELDFLPVFQREGPGSVSFVVGGTSVTLSWPEVSYAYSYVVYRATAEGGPFVSIAANVLVENHVDSDLVPGTYFYKVTAIEPDFGETTSSPVVAVLI